MCLWAMVVFFASCLVGWMCHNYALTSCYVNKMSNTRKIPYSTLSRTMIHIHVYIYICMVDNLRKFIENSVLNIVSIEVKNISSTLGYVYMTVPMEVASSRTVHLPTLSTARISEISMLVKSHFRLRSGHCRHCYSDFCFSVPAISK